MTQQPQSDGSAGSPPPRRRLRRGLKVGAIVIALLVLGSLFDYLGQVRQAIFPWAGWFGYTHSMTPVDIELRSGSGATRLRIPKAYLTFRPNWGGGRQELVVVEAVLPDMRPSSRSRLQKLEHASTNSEVERVEGPAGPVSITLKGSSRSWITEWIRRQIAERWEFRRVTEHGLNLYFEVQRNPDGTLFNPNKPDELKKRHLVVPAEDGRPMVHFECPPTSRPYESWRCSARSHLGDHLYLEYSFEQGHLAQWHEIDRKVRELATSVIVEFAPDLNGDARQP